MPLVKLSDREILERLTTLSGWTIKNNMLVKTYHFPDFVEAMKFVNALAVDAEEMQHHPDIDIRYNKVTLSLTTHDAGGITIKDFELAQKQERHLFVVNGGT